MSWLPFLILNLLRSEGFLTCDINPMVKVNCNDVELVKVIGNYMAHVNIVAAAMNHLCSLVQLLKHFSHEADEFG
nr:hypothetical protein [Tanacetum cinerariifolium]